jgi:hypothetical protein
MKRKLIAAIVLASAVLIAFIVLSAAACENNMTEGYISLSVYGLDGEEMIKNAFVTEYRKNISVADLSKNICRELGIPVVFSGIGEFAYLKGINNLFEFDHGPLSGWIYFVNSESQSIGSASYILRDGDHVEWKYTLDLGKDIGADFE